MKLTLAFVLVAALAAPAAADDFTDYVGHVASDPAAAATYLDGCQALVTPRGEVRRPCKLAIADLVGAQAGVTLTPRNEQFTRTRGDNFTVVDADVDAKAGGKVIATFHVVEVEGPDAKDTHEQVLAMHWSRLAADKDTTAAARAHKLREAPTIADGAIAPPAGMDDQVTYNDATSEALDLIKGGSLEQVIGDVFVHDGVVVGSAPGQRLSGKRGARTWAGWKLSLTQEDGTQVGGLPGAVWAVTKVTVVGKDKVAVPYVALIVFKVEPTEGGVEDLAIAAQFAIAQ